MKIRGVVISVDAGYNDSTIEIRIRDTANIWHKNIINKVDVKKGDDVMCYLYKNLYSVQIERVEKI